MIGRTGCLIVATIVLSAGLPHYGVALPVAPLNKIQVGEFNNVIEVAQRKATTKKTTVKRTTSKGSKARVTKRTTVTKHVDRNVRRNVTVRRNVVYRPYRAWARRPYYGTVVGGVALGTVIGVSAAYAVPAAPAPNMCWYWADRSGRRGYWDYCVAR